MAGITATLRLTNLQVAGCWLHADDIGELEELTSLQQLTLSSGRSLCRSEQPDRRISDVVSGASN
jgi:hypothetical protein